MEKELSEMPTWCVEVLDRRAAELMGVPAPGRASRVPEQL